MTHLTVGTSIVILPDLVRTLKFVTIAAWEPIVSAAITTSTAHDEMICAFVDYLWSMVVTRLFGEEEWLSARQAL